jgi:hypothetical protein
MKHVLIALALLVLFVSYFPVGCGTSGGGGDNISVEDTDPPPAPAQAVISSVRDLGVIRTDSAILKRDCGISAVFQGRSVWLFGDTLLRIPNEENKTFLGNSLSSTYDLDAGDGIAGLTERVDSTGAPAEFFPLTEKEKLLAEDSDDPVCEEESCRGHWDIWPGAILVDEEKDWAYVFYRKVYCESGEFNFFHVGHSLAVWKNFSEAPERPVFNYVDGYPTLFFSEEGEAGFGSAAVIVGKDAYIYGCELEDDPLTKPCHLARVPIADILDKSAWSFFDGAGQWLSNSDESGAIFSGNDMMSVFFNPYINRYVAVYSESLGATAMLRTAENPEGPWSAPKELFDIDAPENVHGWVYDVLAHPELSQDNGRIIYITYTKKLDKMTSELRLVAVELALPR